MLRIFLTDSHVPDKFGYYSDKPIRLTTANGESSSSKQGKVFVPELGSKIDPYLVRSTPPVLSVGMRCIDQGYDFVWRGSRKENPYFRKPDGTKIEMVVDDYVPYIPSSCHVALPAVEGNDIINESPEAMPSPATNELPVIEDSPEYEPSIAPLESEDEIEELAKEVRELEEFTKKQDAGREAEPMSEEEEDAIDVPREVAIKRDRGKRALIEEAKSIEHQLCHLPKNPYCDVCNKSKMIKPPSYKTGGSSQIESKTFGQHLTGDFLVTKDSGDLGIDNEKVALVLKDVTTDFRYVYPSARRDSREVILAFKHFLAQGDKVEVFYSDNAPELIKAASVMSY